MDLFWCWLVAPAGLLLVAVGLSLLVERIAGFTVPWALRPGLGLAGAIVLAQFGTATDATAEPTRPAIIVLAAAGLIAGRGRLKRPAAPWGAGAGALVFVLLASPFLVLGEATWAGYIKLDDTATWMALTDHIFEFGRGVGQLPPSTHEAVVQINLGGSYPIGGFVPAGLMATISGQDVAFVIQPSMAFAAATMALALFELLRRPAGGPATAAVIAVLASLSSLLLGYYLWGGVKELVTAALLPLAPALAGAGARAGWQRAATVPLAVAAAALIALLGPGAAAWLLPTLTPAFVLHWRLRGAAAAWRIAGPAALLSLLLALPVLITPNGLFDPLQGGLTESTELGNLVGPLSPLQAAGIWPSLDFRFDPHLEGAVIVLASVCLLSALGSVIVCARLPGREGVPFAAYAGGGTLGAVAIVIAGSPWIDAKAMASISPALLAAALLGVVMLGRRARFRPGAAVLGAVIAAAVLWSAFLAYQGAWFAPRAHYTELERIGEEFAGKGPALSTEVSIYGPRHFLRKLDAEGATDLRRRQVYLVGGRSSADGSYVDLDQIEPDQLDPYNLLVVRRGPATSRAPAGFELAYAGTYHDVWRRVGGAGRLLGHLSLGDDLDAGAVPDCVDVGRLAGAAGEGGTLTAARAGHPLTIDFSSAQMPPSWRLPIPWAVHPSGSGSLRASADVGSGTYELWLGGAVFGGLDLYVDGRRVASERAVLNNEGGLEPMARIELAAGRHSFRLDYHGADLQPGSAADPYAIGPLILAAPRRGDLGTIEVAPADYRRLCGHRWDWIEGRAQPQVSNGHGR